MMQTSSTRSSAQPYDPSSYWGSLVAGDGSLANVGQSALGSYNRYAYRVRLARVKKALAGLPLANMSVFEAAFGECFYMNYWRSIPVKRAAGMDISATAAEAARKRFPDYDLRCGDLSDTNAFAGIGCADLVTAIDVLYHIVDDAKWEAALRNLLGLVGEGGWFLFTDKFPRREPYHKHAHVRRRPLAMYERVLDAHGVKVRSITPMFFLMDDPITVGNHPMLGQLAMLQWRVLSKTLRLTAKMRGLQSALAAVGAGVQWIPEHMLLATVKRSPNLEIVLCRREG